MKNILKIAFTIIVLLFVFGYIAGLANEENKRKTEIENKPDNSIMIKDTDIQGWPLTVKSGKLWCDGSNILLLAEGSLYGINGAGQSFAESHGGKKLETIWAVDEKAKKEYMKLGLSEEKATIRMDITPLLEKGKSLCNDKK